MGWPPGMSYSRAPVLKKTPHRGELKDFLPRQIGGDHFSLRSGVNFIQMHLGHRFCCELPYAFVKSAFSNDVGKFVSEAFVIG